MYWQNNNTNTLLVPSHQDITRPFNSNTIEISYDYFTPIPSKYQETPLLPSH